MWKHKTVPYFTFLAIKSKQTIHSMKASLYGLFIFHGSDKLSNMNWLKYFCVSMMGRIDAFEETYLNFKDQCKYNIWKIINVLIFNAVLGGLIP